MKTRRNMVKRWIAGVLAVTMLSSTMSTAAFAAPESTDAPETVETTRVTAWNWTDGSALTWQEDTSAWTLTLSEEQTISAEADLLALLPVSVEATLAQAETEATPAPETAATPAPESTPDTEATEVTPTPAAEVDPAAEEEAAAPAAAALALPEEGATDADTLSVEPQNNEEATPAPETATPAPTATPQPAESPAPTAEAEPTEEPAAEADTETLTLTWDTAALTYPMAGGDYTVTAALPEGYALDEAAPALAVVVKVPGAGSEDTPAADNSLSDSASAPSMLADAGTIDTIDPVGTTINLFDYWIGTSATDPQGDQEFNNPHDYLLLPDTDGDLGRGINYNHILKFTRGGAYTDKIQFTTEGNNVSNGPYKNIVQSKLVNGYPKLNDQTVKQGWALSYVGTKYTCDESLQYLFDPSASNNYRNAYEDVKGLLSLQDGYYTYDSSQNYAEYDSGSNSFTVYDQPNQGFFPFTSFDDIHRKNNDENGEIIANHYFGLTMTTRFVQQNNGYTTDGTDQPVTYEFTGDDDVWVFIDGVLVGDLGGIHGAASLNINFSTGAITVNNSFDGTLYEKFYDAGSAGETNWNSSNTTFANNTTHVLQLFYLERGNFDSNLKLSFNMESVFESSIKNVDQNGSGIAGTVFDLYAADSSYEILQNGYHFQASTEGDGVLKLQDGSGQNIKLEDLKKFSDYFVLKEAATPAGYRSAGEVHLYFLQGVSEPILLCANPWESGAYANPAVTATLPEEVETQDGNKLQTLTAPGTFFAVVMKRKQGGANDVNGWQPVYGDPYDKGWSTLENASAENILLAAQNSPYVFKPDNNGLRVTIDNLPGSIQAYYYILSQTNPSNAEDNAEYTVVYFYKDENGNLQRLKTDNIDRIFSAQVCVSNVKNYLIVQQTNEDGTKKLEGATFELYQDTGLAKENGQLLLNDEGKPYLASDAQKTSVTPYDSVTTQNQNQADHDLVTAEGSAVFPSADKVLTNGTYYILDAEAPLGYDVTQQVVKVVVNDTGVYADAGAEKDDVTVLRGAGKIVRSMLQFAVPDVVSTTLTDITATLMEPVENGDPAVDTKWQAVTSQPNELKLSYHTSEVPLEYGLSTGAGEPYFVVEEGWSRVQITQNYNNNTLLNRPADLADPGDKEELSEPLTNLFSRSTVIRVKNDVQLLDLTIKNTIDGTLIGNDSNQPFEVTITLTEGTTDNLADSYKYTVEGDSTEKELSLSKVEDSQPSGSVQKVGTVTMIPGQTITITGIPYGTGFSITAAGNVNYTTEYSVTPEAVDGDTHNDGAGTLTENGKVTITNTRITEGSVKVTNTVDGAMGSYSDEFTYTLKLYDKTQDDSNPTIDGTYDATLKTAGQADQPVKITFEGGVATTMTPVVEGGETPQAQDIKLVHGDTLTIQNLPAGATCEATEGNSNKGYTTTVDGAVKYTGTAIVSADSTPATIAFINTRAAIVPTGMREENNPYIVMIGLAGMAALVGAAGWVEMRRRKRREEE